MKFAICTPRFGHEINGGNEKLLWQLANRLKDNHDLVVLTTTAFDNRTWAPHYPAGHVTENGVEIIRFDHQTINTDIFVPISIAINEGLKIPLEEQFAWMESGVNSSALYAYLAENKDNFDYIFFSPYLFPTTFWGSLICQENAVLLPSLHNEYYAYLDIVQAMFRMIGRAIFHSNPEQEFAKTLAPDIKSYVVGMHFDPAPRLTEEDFRGCRFSFSNKNDSLQYKKYLLVLGRKETGKSGQIILDYFIKAKEAGLWPDLKLVIAGSGSFSDLERPTAPEHHDIYDCINLGDEEKLNLLAGATCLVQPSVNESFSIVLMESWGVKTPVLVNGNCEVTKFHAEKSEGGLVFYDYDDFVNELEKLLEDQTLRATLAENGHKYVEREYNQAAVDKRFFKALEKLEKK